MVRTLAQIQPLFPSQNSPLCVFPLFFFLFLSLPFHISYCFSCLTFPDWSHALHTKGMPSFVLLSCLFEKVRGKSITQIHRVVFVIVYDKAARMSQCDFSGPIFSFFPHMGILWRMSTVRAHRVIKFRFVRLISILIKTLTPPYAIKGPRHSFLPHEERDRWTQKMDKSERKRKGEKMSSATAAECDSASQH